MSKQLEIAPDQKNGKSVALREMQGIKAIEEFTRIINQDPAPSNLQKTPDGKADTMGISFVEAKLDEIYMRQWGTRNVQILQIANELLVWLDLWVIDPQTQREVTRAGFASVQITVDAAPDDLQWKQGDSPELTARKKKEKNAWALDMQNKKPNALYLAFPKAKSLALKNAAQTLGNIFGRNLNRKYEDTPGDFYTDILNDTENLSEAKKELHAAKTVQEFDALWNKYPELQQNEEFQKEFMYFKRKNVR